MQGCGACGSPGPAESLHGCSRNSENDQPGQWEGSPREGRPPATPAEEPTGARQVVLKAPVPQVNRFNKSRDRALLLTDRHLYKLEPGRQYRVMRTVPLDAVSPVGGGGVPGASVARWSCRALPSPPLTSAWDGLGFLEFSISSGW